MRTTMVLLVLSLYGDALGLFLASFPRYVLIPALDFGLLSELTLSFALLPSIVVLSLLFVTLTGVVGSFLPSIRAVRLSIVSTLQSL
jgi:ABC-type antimicrobial peptide transport system permease subunit